MTTEEARVGPGIALRFDRAESGAGDGATAVLYLHGLGSSQSGDKAEFFRRRFMESGTPFCSIDFRGHGESEETNLGLSLSRNLEDVRFARDYLASHGHGEIDLVGSSLGGLTALWTARLEPEGVRRVAAVAPAIGIRDKIVEMLDESLLERWRRDGNLPYINELGTTVIGYRFFDDLEEYSVSRLAASYDKPTLILQGELDESVDPRAVRAFADSLESVEIRSWADGDHRLTERLDQVWSEMARFLVSSQAST